MAKDPAFLFYPNDWLGGTMGMTFEEKGAYMELLMLQFNRGHMTSHMIGQTVGQLFGQIKDKFKEDSEGLWFNERLDIEKEKRKNYTESRINNKNGKNQHTEKVGHMTSHMIGHMEDVNENVNKVIKEDKFPTIEESESYFISKGSSKIESDKFFYFYSSKGWKVGKNQMVSWKSAAIGWISRNKPVSLRPKFQD